MGDSKSSNRVVLTTEFLDFEKRNNLFERSVDGFFYWHLIRKWIFDNVCKQSRSFEFGGHADFHAQFNRSNIVRRFSKLSSQVVRSYFDLNGDRLKECDVLFFGNWKKSNGPAGAYNLFLDGLIEELPLNCVIFERPNQLVHRDDRYLGKTVYSDIFELSWLVALSTGKWRSKADEVFRDLANVVDGVDESFYVNVDRGALKKRVDYVTSGYYEISRRAKHLFSKTKIKCIVEIEHYCVFCLICNQVFHELGIPVVEMQHGQIGPGHIAYNLTAKGVGRYLPDRIATFGQYWADRCAYPNKAESMVPVGSIPLDRERNTFSNNVAAGSNTVLIVSQGKDGGALSGFTCRLARESGLTRDQIIYKLHPSEFSSWESLHPDLAAIKDDITVVSNEHELGYYINRSSMIVGISSTVLFEAVAYGKRVYVLDAVDSEIAEPLIELGFARSVSGVQDFIDAFGDDVPECNRARIDYMWKQGALKNMKKLINRVASKYA